MMDLRLFRIRAFSAGLAAVLVAFAGLFTATFLLPFLLQEGSGYTPLRGRAAPHPDPDRGALVAPFSGTLSDRIGQRVPASIGIAILALGLLSLTTLPDDFSVARPRVAPRAHRRRAGALPVAEQQLHPRLGAAAAPRHGVRDDRPDAGGRPGAGDRGQRGGGARCASRPTSRRSRACRPSEARQEALVMATHDAFIVAALICSIGIVASLMRGGPQAQVIGEVPIAG